MTSLYLGYSVGAQGEVGWEGTWDLLRRRELISSHRVSHRSRLSNIHFLLLVFLKLPLFLGMVGAVLWVNRPQRHPGGRERQLDPGSPPCSVPFPGMPCPGIQLFRLDKRDLQILGSRAGGQQLLDSGRTQVFWGHWSREGPGS